MMQSTILVTKYARSLENSQNMAEAYEHSLMRPIGSESQKSNGPCKGLSCQEPQSKISKSLHEPSELKEEGCFVGENESHLNANDI